MLEKPKKSRRVLSIFVLAMLNVSVMASLRNLPLVAEYGLGSVFYFALVALLFLVPCALISAELATGWPKTGGIYIWVREALGDRWGFFAVWVQWAHNLSWYPVILSFVATTLAYIIMPELGANKHYVLAVVLVSFWGMTLLNYLGIKTSSWFSTLGVIAGTILPGLFIITLGISWITGGHLAQTSLEPSAILPKAANLNSLVFLAGMFLAFAGLEVTAAHAGDVVNPQKNYPRSILLAALITFVLFMLGSLSIAVVIPNHEISLVAGVIEAFNRFFMAYNLQWILPIMAVLLIIGAIAEVNAWIIGPVKGLYATSIHGNLPPVFQKQNKKGVPVNLLLFQAIIVTLSAFIFLHMPTVSASFWILTALSAQSYLVMYILMFVSAIKLRYSKPNVVREYRVPYKMPGMWITAGLGILSSSFAIFMSFFPPSQLETGSLLFYELFLIIGLFIMCGIPLIIYQFRQPSWIRDR
ncbi:MAG TPA: amino acid permease [Rhabdochlamydiaceae bacterium]|jgi:putative glutamate/gamma-aminobutyrate antiporter|nr:amino acid permease [Rhabdochlamydiaceae bacterium]